MQIDWKYGLGIIILLIGIGYSIGRYIQPAKIVTKTEIVVKEHVHTVTVTVTKPDGTKTTTTTQDDDKSTKDKSSTITTLDKPSWKVAGLAGLSLNNLTAPIYGGQIERRIIGSVSAGVWGLNNGTGGVSLGIQF